MNIIKTRGDTIKIRFGIRIENELYALQDCDRLYLTIKKDADLLAPTYQYRMGEGITYDADTQKYTVVIPSCDTCNMECADYLYDIELVRGFDSERDTATLLKGIITFTEDITRRENEE